MSGEGLDSATTPAASAPAPSAPSASPATGTTTGEPRRFGFWTGYFLVVASMVGAGILTTSGFTLRATGNPATLLAVWIVGGLMALCGALTLVELATLFPRVGGDYIFVREGFGRRAGIVSGWATFLLGFAAPTAVIARQAIDYLLVPFGSVRDSLPAALQSSLSPLLASVLVVVIALTHGLGHQQSAWMQGWTTIAKLVVLLALALAGLFWGQGDWSHFAAGGWPATREWPALATALVYVGYAYSGWNGATYLAGEIREPRRLLPRATIAGCLTVLALYVLINVVYVFALDPVGMTRRTPEEVEPVAKLAAVALFGGGAARGVSVVLGVGLVASVSAYLLAGPRIAVAMAQDGVFPAIGGRLHPRRQTPVNATLIQAIAAVAVLWSGSFVAILDYASIGLIAVAALVVASIVPIRRRRDLMPAYRMPFYPLPPLVFLSLSLWTIVSSLLQPDRRVPTLLSLATFALCIPLSRLVQGRSKPQAP